MNLSTVLDLLLFVLAGAISSLLTWLIFRKRLTDDWFDVIMMGWVALFGISVIGAAKIANYQASAKIAIPAAVISAFLSFWFLLNRHNCSIKTKSG